MAFICGMKCAGIIIDIHDSERVAMGVSKNKYYITPSRTTQVNQWLWENGLDMVTTAEHVQELVDKKILGVY